VNEENVLVSPEYREFTQDQTLVEPEEEKIGEYPGESILKPESSAYEKYVVSKPRRVTIYAKILDD